MSAEKTDHKAEALREARAWCKAADREAGADRPGLATSFAAVSNAYSNLAIAEGQERVAEELAKFNKRFESILTHSPSDQFGSGKRYLRVKP